MIRDGITVGGKHSFADFGLVINSRSIGYPAKKVIRKTVPYMSGFYDYTALNGVPAWGERVISYTFDVIGVTVAEMDVERQKVINWLCNIHDEDIFDDTIPDYHFHGSFESVSPSEDGEQATITFSFVCHPFMIANDPRSYTFFEGGSYQIVNNGQPASAKISTAQSCVVSVGGRVISIPPVDEYAILLGNGSHELSVEKVNEIQYPYINSTTTNNGITFTDNGDGTITANGTATDVAWCWIRGSSEVFLPPVGKHRASGCPANVGANNYRIQYYVYNGPDEEPKYYYDFGSGVVIDVTEHTQYISVAVRIVSGYTASNIVFSPQLLGETTISFAEEVL